MTQAQALMLEFLCQLWSNIASVFVGRYGRRMFIRYTRYWNIQKINKEFFCWGQLGMSEYRTRLSQYFISIPWSSTACLMTCFLQPPPNDFSLCQLYLMTSLFASAAMRNVHLNDTINSHTLYFHLMNLSFYWFTLFNDFPINTWCCSLS